MPCLVRPAALADCAELGRLGTHLMHLHHLWDRRRFISVEVTTPQAYARFFEKQILRPEVVLLVAATGRKLAGYSFAAVEGPDYMALRGPAGVLHDLFVKPRSRKKGAGKLLVQQTVSELHKRGATQVVLSTFSKNVAAQHLFATLGFRPTMLEMTKDIGS